MNIYNDTPEIRKQIEFMKNCQNKVKNILGVFSDYAKEVEVE